MRKEMIFTEGKEKRTSPLIILSMCLFWFVLVFLLVLFSIEETTELLKERETRYHNYHRTQREEKRVDMQME